MIPPPVYAPASARLIVFETYRFQKSQPFKQEQHFSFLIAMNIFIRNFLIPPKFSALMSCIIKLIWVQIHYTPIRHISYWCKDV